MALFRGTFGDDLARLRWLAQWPALSVLVLIRYDIGYRSLHLGALIIIFCILSFFGLNQNNAPFRPHDLFYFAVVMLVSGITQKILRWRTFAKRIQHHSYFVGTSIWDKPNMPRFMQRNRRIPRYFDPGAVFLLGLVLLYITPMLAVWLMIAGFSLFVMEVSVHRKSMQRQFDAMDGLIEGGVHNERVGRFVNDPKPKQPTTNNPPVPTGIGEDIEEKVRIRKQPTDEQPN